MSVEHVLQVHGLKVYYHTPQGPVKAVDDVSFSVGQGEKLGLVGESGCGKSTTAFALLRLIKPPGRIEGGEILLNGVNVASLSNEELRKTRFAHISLIPQGAMNSLNPVMRIRHQIMDVIQYHDDDMPKRQLIDRVHELLAWVGLPVEVAEMYPHELSGGMKQRVCIAMAISLQPDVIIADEPTSALDVVVQRQVVETLSRVQQELGASVIIVGHDMGLMAQFADRIAVMYAGKLVEDGPVEQIFEEPLHPYTQMLISSLPSLDVKGVFRGNPGLTPSLLHPPDGCLFHTRCPYVMEQCSVVTPELTEVRDERVVACHLYGGSR